MARTFTLILTETEADAMTEAWGVISALACAEPLLATLFFERFLKADKTLTEKVTLLLRDVAAAKGIQIPNFDAEHKAVFNPPVDTEKVSRDEQATRDSWAGRLGQDTNDKQV